MNFGSKIGQQRHGFPLTSMIDLLFILLIFFMTASMYAQFESELNVRLPVATEATDIEREPTEIIINVADNGKIVVLQEERTMEWIDSTFQKIAQLGGAHIIIRGDRETAWSNIVKVLNACEKANIWNVSFGVLPTGEAAEE